MQCEAICARLDDELDTDAYASVDASANGLQVGPATQDVSHAAFAVDTAVETIEAAAEAGADLLVTHHGLSWGGIERVTGTDYRRIAALVENDIALYTSHLPLDGHQELGNAAGVADLLELDERAPFGEIGGQYIGQRGRTFELNTVDAVREQLRAHLDTGGQTIQVLDFGTEPVHDIAIVTGSGIDWLDEAVENDVDALITGEGKQKAYHEARDAGLHVLLAGHYATETFGVESLRRLVARWGVETTFIDCPTGL